MRVLHGCARKISLPFVLLSVAGWITFAVGFGMRNFNVQDASGLPAIDLIYFPQWCFGVAALLLYAVTITHLFCGNPITVFLIMTLQAFFFATGGTVLHSNGEEIRMNWNNGTQLDLHANRVFVPVEFAGVGVAMLLFWISLLFWPCFKRKKDEDDDDE